MKEKLFYILVGATCAAIPTVFLGGALIDERDKHQILIWENINLRGYKEAYIDLLGKSDTLHVGCLRESSELINMRRNQGGETLEITGTMSISTTGTFSSKGSKTMTIECMTCKNQTVCNIPN
jgi:hypothetical protein